MSRERRLAERGLRQARRRMVEAPSEDEALIALHETLGWIYSLHEHHRNRLGNPRYCDACKHSCAGQAVLAMVSARGATVHKLVMPSNQAALYPAHYGPTYGTFAWKNEPPPPAPNNREEYRERDAAYYRKHLAGQPVDDTLQIAEGFLTQEIAST